MSKDHLSPNMSSEQLNGQSDLFLFVSIKYVKNNLQFESSLYIYTCNMQANLQIKK